MRPGTAFAWLLTGGLTLAGAVLLQPRAGPQPAGAGQPMFQDLAPRLPQAARIEISGSGKSSTLARDGDRWGLVERGMYPVQPARLRALLAGLAELRLSEPRTADPALYGRLGVDDPAAAGSTATLLRVRTADGSLLAETLLGHRSQRSRGGLPETVYVRRPTDTGSWLAEGRLAADPDPQAWMIREIASIAADRVARVVVQRGADRLVFERKDTGLILLDPPAGKPDSFHIEETGRALDGLTLADVTPGAGPGTPIGQSVFTLTDGTAVTIALSRDDTRLWARFTAEGPGAAAFGQLAGWSYQLPEWRETALLPKPSDMVLADPPP